MIGNINNFSLYSQELSNDITTFVFSFDKPTGNVGGYFLYQSFDDTSFVQVKFLVDLVHKKYYSDPSLYTTEGGSSSYFTYSVNPGTVDGRSVYFQLVAISISNELSDPTSSILTHTAPTRPVNLKTVYDGYQVHLTWDNLDTSNGRNSELTGFSIYRKWMPALSDTIYDSVYHTIVSTSLTIGKSLFVFDSIKKSSWFGVIVTEGSFPLDSTTKITLASDTSNEYEPSANNLSCFLEDPTTSVLVATSLTNEGDDTVFTFDSHYVYSVISNGDSGKNSGESKISAYTVDTLQAYPYLRSPGNADNTVLQQTEWKTLKEVLIDKNYYNKDQFAIPYFKHEPYRFKGYLGVANCKLDVWINGIISTTLETDDYGQFLVSLTLPKGTTELEFQGRDKLNINFSRKSAPYQITTLNIYTWFYVIGDQYRQVLEEMELSRVDEAISQARYFAFVDRYAPLIEFYKIGDESETVFRYLATEIFKAFEYAAYDKSLSIVLDAFNSQLTNFDHYEIYYNEDLYNTQRTAYTFTATSSGLVRSNYYYGVSACSSNGAETDVTRLRIDRRWWPKYYYNTTVLMWDYVSGANSYKIYRGTSDGNLYFLTSTGYNVFIDIGELQETASIYPRLYNYTDLNRPQNLKLYDRYGVNNLFLRLKKPTSLAIILYGKADTELEDYNLQRLLSLFEKLIPPELNYRVIFANDNKVVLYPEGREIDLSEPELVYAIYDESYFNNNEVYS